MKPTKEQIDAALFVASHYIHLDLPDWFPPAIRVLCSAIHDLRAELAAERAARAKTQAEHSEAPTDEELAAEAARFATAIVGEDGGAARALEALADPPPVATWERLAVAYVAGARRESR